MQTRAALLTVFFASVLNVAHAQDHDLTAPEAEPAPEAEAAPEAEPALEAEAAAEPEPAAAPALSRVDSSAPLSGGERWVKENGRWKLQRINYRYLDHADYAPRPALAPGINDFPEPQAGVVLSTRWFGGSGWRWRATPYVGWGFGWGNGWGIGSVPWGWGNGWGIGGVPWGWGNRYDGFGYGGRGFGRGGYGRGNRGFRSRFGMSLGWGLGF